MLNAPGTIDEDYRGEIKVILHNTSHSSFFYAHPGERIAQLVLAPVTRANVVETAQLSPTLRGEGAFGSTGS